MNYETLPVLVAGHPQGDQARKEDSQSQSKRCRVPVPVRRQGT